jgi:hypothetical protein
VRQLLRLFVVRIDGGRRAVTATASDLRAELEEMNLEESRFSAQTERVLPYRVISK